MAARGTAGSPRLAVDVLVAAVCFCLSAGTTGAAARLPQEPPTAILLLGWPVFALAGGVLLDQRPGSRLGRVLTALSLMPLLDTAWAVARFGGWPTSVDLVRAVAETGGGQVAVVAIALPWSVRPPLARSGRPLVPLPAAAGAVAVALAESGVLPSLRFVGWVLVLLGAAGAWTLVLRDVRTDGRTSRRRTTWLLLVLAASAVALAVAWLGFSTAVGCYVTACVLAVIAVSVTRLSFLTDLRPLDEHALDLAVVVAALAACATVAALVRVGAGLTRLPSPTTTAAFSALLTAAMAAPAAMWVRRTALQRRYGNGTISPADVAVITADLHAQTEPRDLLDKAARMVAAASGTNASQIVLGEDAPTVPEHWVLHPLVVGGDRVGALLVEPNHPEGLEMRQQQVVAQLLPTVALVARAVGLAVEAEHARRDVARERDAERRRILGDLHDGLGPVLAGMSMRVQATLRTDPSPAYVDLLTDLADGLAGSRTDLRRIVAGITPSALEDGDLESALERLVGSFRGGGGGSRISLEVAVEAGLPAAVQVAVYRCVAEGVTNALRHAAAGCIEVRVRSARGTVEVDVTDDGVGGRVVSGVGLSSLAQRADSLGGRLAVVAAVPTGTHLHLELPCTSGARA